MNKDSKFSKIEVKTLSKIILKKIIERDTGR